MCRRHYQEVQAATAQRCSIEECDKPAHSRGWCSPHYSRWHSTGDPLTPLKRQPNTGPCTVDGCNEPMRKRTWCASHYNQWRRTGEVRPFRYKWAAKDGLCVVCGEPVPKESKRRKHCSGACQTVDSRTAGKRPTHFTCRLCGTVVSLRARYENGRLIRTDMIWCRSCGRDSSDALRYKRYGITPDEYAAAVERGCPICKRTGVKLHLDHDHSCCGPRKFRLCGKCARGLICGNCNRALGLMRDDVNALEAAAAYLKRTT